ncbi:AMP-binding protein [Bradyrhizobium sp. G127]|uniref:AMP-binding protein n=1 Tax=Bradyrhizobium sp. G127 TaxID=2904800 RepID=UPI001F30BC01|nr:AMP-binding protein [Bradyrhizobium sp. G127]MCF2525126.1 AMP-binding protein [Bradyrhizobium sp. G127]
MAALAGELALSHYPPDRSEPVLERSIGDALRAAAAIWPDRTALVEGLPDRTKRRRWTFASLLAESEQVARAIAARFAPGEHVAVWAANCPEWALVEFGAALAGVTLVTANPAYLANELAFVLKQSQAVGIFVQPHYRDRDLVAVVERVRSELPRLREVIPLSSWSEFLQSASDAALPAVGPDDIAQIQYTSGTTGFPKGARLTHRGLGNNGRFFARTVGAGADDVWINPMPMFHTAGCGLVTLGALQTGGTHVMPPGFDPELMIQLCEEERGTIMLGVPTMVIRMLDDPSLPQRDVASWRLALMGGAPVPPELVRRAAQLVPGLKVAIGFGQTESSPYLTHTLPDDPHPDWIATVGRPMPQTEVRIVDPQSGDTSPLETIGEICARGYGVMRDYFDNPGATAGAIDADGWLHTGDLGSMDKYGYCRVQGRLKDLIIRGGENIYPREVEDVLFTHPAVATVAVIGVPDREWGEIVVAFVQTKATADEAALTAFCRERLASYKVPRIWRFVAQFPQTASGKIQKFVLRDQYLAGKI